MNKTVGFFVEKINKIENGYKCDGLMNYGWGRKIFITNPTKGKHTLYILYDGDYINVYEDSKDKLLMTYAITDEKTLKEFNNLIITGKCDLSRVTWPRHADGTSDYDDKIIMPEPLISTKNTSLDKTTAGKNNCKDENE